MDTTPPQAPPALTQSEHQQALDTVRRLADVQRWLVEQRSALPVWPVSPTTQGKDAYLDGLTDYWRAPVVLAPGADPVTRASALATQLAGAMRDDAVLLGLDGTLDERAVAWATSFSRSPATSPGFIASELLIGDTPYAGALVLQKPDETDLVLLFMPDAGWQAFSGMDDLHEAAEKHFREALLTDEELPGIVQDDIEPLLDAPFVSSRAMGPDPFHELVSRIARVQEQRVAEAWSDVAEGLVDAGALADRVRDALDMNDHLDVHAMLARRDVRLGDAVQEARLASLPASVRADWKHARQAYVDALATASQRRAAAGLTDITPLGEFVEDALKRELTARGVTDAPADLVVRITPVPGEVTGLLSHVFQGPSTQRAGLVEFAYQNIGRLSVAALGLERADGAAPSVSLDGRAIRDIVRRADVGTAYADYLDRQLMSSPQATMSRAIARDLQQARMRFELEECRLSYYRQDVPRAFAYADRDVGYRWMKAVIDAPTPSSRPTVDGYTIVARQVTYGGVPLAEVFEVGTSSQNSSSRVVLYTPGAPDDVVFREFHSREDAARRFFLNPANEGWLLDRLPGTFAETAANGSRRFKVSDAAQRSHWVFAQQDPGHYTRMEENLDHRVVEGHLIDALYATSVSLMKDHVATLTRATTSADWQSATHALASATAAASPVPHLAGEVLAQALRQTGQIMPALWRMEENIKAGDHPQAFLDLVQAYHSSLNVIGVRSLPGARLPGSLVRAGHRSASVVSSRQRVPHPDAIFESRFVAHGIDPATAESVHAGVLTLRDNHYISQHGRLYGVRFDAGAGTWRLARPGALDAHFTGPAVERGVSGAWRMSRGVGLRGGGENGSRKLLGRMRAERAQPRVATLSQNQRRALLSELSRLTGSRADAVSIYASMRPADAALRGRGLTLVQQGYFHRALEYAEQIPRIPRIPPLGRVEPFAIRPRAAAASSAPRPSGPQPGFSGGVAVRHPAGLALTRPPAAPLVALPPTAWPDTVWIYLSEAEVAARTGAVDIRIPQGVLAQGRVAGVAGLTLPPETPLAGIPGSVLAGVGTGDTLGSVARGWVRVDLRAVRARAGNDGLPLFQLSRAGAPGSTGVVITPRPSIGDPAAMRDVWLAAGEYELGVWPRAAVSRP
ncbi:DUF6543 domain-containing protein [Luteibacter sp. 9135]|uniref:DUF6543 domain-containing protein n=1 Tax=Luteibacter sp. 9135 TaxID=1500893 RepID=UPI00055BE219|nr:DUF6543 domain-containing protein [Luteibacter sp. 9135]